MLSLTESLTESLTVSIDLTDVTLVSDDTYRTLYWCDPDNRDEVKIVEEVKIDKEVKIVKEVKIAKEVKMVKEVKIVKEVERSDSLWRFACGDV